MSTTFPRWSSSPGSLRRLKRPLAPLLAACLCGPASAARTRLPELHEALPLVHDFFEAPGPNLGALRERVLDPILNLEPAERARLDETGQVQKLEDKTFNLMKAMSRRLLTAPEPASADELKDAKARLEAVNLPLVLERLKLDGREKAALAAKLKTVRARLLAVEAGREDGLVEETTADWGRRAGAPVPLPESPPQRIFLQKPAAAPRPEPGFLRIADDLARGVSRRAPLLSPRQASGLLAAAGAAGMIIGRFAIGLNAAGLAAATASFLLFALSLSHFILLQVFAQTAQKMGSPAGLADAAAARLWRAVQAEPWESRERFLRLEGFPSLVERRAEAMLVSGRLAARLLERGEKLGYRVVARELVELDKKELKSAVLESRMPAKDALPGKAVEFYVRLREDVNALYLPGAPLSSVLEISLRILDAQGAGIR